jgi:hypothetical protein
LGRFRKWAKKKKNNFFPTERKNAWISKKFIVGLETDIILNKEMLKRNVMLDIKLKKPSSSHL